MRNRNSENAYKSLLLSLEYNIMLEVREGLDGIIQKYDFDDDQIRKNHVLNIEIDKKKPHEPIKILN